MHYAVYINYIVSRFLEQKRTFPTIRIRKKCVDPLDSKGNSATSNNTKLVHWPLMGGLLHLVQRGGALVGWASTQSPPRCTKCNSLPINGQCTNHRILLCDGRLLCGFNVAIKGLSTAFLDQRTLRCCLFISKTVNHLRANKSAGPCFRGFAQ